MDMFLLLTLNVGFDVKLQLLVTFLKPIMSTIEK